MLIRSEIFLDFSTKHGQRDFARELNDYVDVNTIILRFLHVNSTYVFILCQWSRIRQFYFWRMPQIIQRVIFPPSSFACQYKTWPMLIITWTINWISTSCNRGRQIQTLKSFWYQTSWFWNEIYFLLCIYNWAHEILILFYCI